MESEGDVVVGVLGGVDLPQVVEHLGEQPARGIVDRTVWRSGSVRVSRRRRV